jgi:hypothetical protein
MSVRQNTDIPSMAEVLAQWQQSERTPRRWITREEVKQRAMKMGVTTGNMPSVDLIWKIQQQEQHQTCFGQGQGCFQRDCYWWKQCLTLDSFANTGAMSDL